MQCTQCHSWKYYVSKEKSVLQHTWCFLGVCWMDELAWNWKMAHYNEQKGNYIRSMIAFYVATCLQKMERQGCVINWAINRPPSLSHLGHQSSIMDVDKIISNVRIVKVWEKNTQGHVNIMAIFTVLSVVNLYLNMRKLQRKSVQAKLL